MWHLHANTQTNERLTFWLHNIRFGAFRDANEAFRSLDVGEPPFDRRRKA
jgi:hypothetical protein